MLDTRGVRLAYEVDGPATAPALLLCNSLGTDLELWQPQLDRLATARRVIRHDTRGHGESSAPAPPYTLEELGADALAVLDAVGVDRADVCGISLGGQVALWLAIHHPERVRRLVLANTAARVGNSTGWDERIAAVREQGMTGVADLVVGRFFSADFRRRRPDIVAKTKATLAAIPEDGYVGCCAALRDADLRAEVGRVTAATLVVAGAWDDATPPAAAQELADAITSSELVHLQAGHLSNLERPRAFSTAVLDFLDQPLDRHKETT